MIKSVWKYRGQSTQGTIGTENELAAEDIDAADVVILAIDVKIKGEERFKNKRIVRVKTEVVIKSPIQFIEKVEKSLANA